MLRGEEVKICYTPENKPYLDGRKEHISISHSHDRLAIALNSSESTGIDIELLRDKVKNVAHKFLNPAEAAYAGLDVEKLIRIWAAKEALYKAFSKKGIDFKTQLEVDDAGPGLLKGKIRMNGDSKEYLLFHKRMQEYMLVFTLNEI